MFRILMVFFYLKINTFNEALFPRGLIPFIHNEAYNGLNCMVLPDNNDFTNVALRVNRAGCPSFDCWESHITLKHRALLAYIYNQFREEISTEHDTTLMRLFWNWSLEYDAIQVLKDCPSERTATIETRDVPGLDYEMSCEETITRFPVKNNSQEGILYIFWDMLNNTQEDKLDNFDENGKFRRSSATHFGCSYIISDSPPYEGYLACIYCTTSTSVSVLLNECPPGTILLRLYGIISPLCYPYPTELVQTIRIVDTYICELPNMPSICPRSPQPSYWWEPVIWTNGSLKQHYFIHDEAQKFQFFLKNKLVSDDGKGIYHDTPVRFNNSPPISAWFFTYSNITLLEELNRTMYNYTSAYLRFPTYNTITLIDQGYTPAACCLHLFLAHLLVSAILIFGVCYTHYHMTKRRHSYRIALKK